MKRPLETARRWLAQAEHSLSVSRVLFENGFWAEVCLQSEQTAQFALKAFLYYKGRRFIHIHSIRELILECGKEDQEFLGFLTRGMTLDQYYTSTRYPDALPAPAVPFEVFTEQQASEALRFATDMVELTRGKITN
jgi:HEPN domain-containing protein